MCIRDRYQRRVHGVLVMISGVFLAKSTIISHGLEKDKYTILIKGSNISKINAKGEVKSETTTNVYSNIELPIKETKVEIGDRVKVGDVLALLDTKKLKDQIEEKEETIKAADSSNAINLKNTKEIYDNLVSHSSDENNSDIKNAIAALNSAQLDYDNKKDLYEKYKLLNKNGGVSDQELTEYANSYYNAKNTYDKCKVELDNIRAKVQLDLNTAKNNYEAAEVKCSDKSDHITLEKMKNDLKDAVIKSPVDGLISKKNASVGNESTGELFEIKDENNINVIVDVKDVDIEKIKEGQKAEIKTDSTGDDIIDGEVINIKSIAKEDLSLIHI
eukprot:TRINITY_DN7615_c0_g1_i24.p2 TRINITY_DN7615_c0_g1~~TRINITY_DN7615_c0_g1_i24.p2  ORF type:complete len:331 (+),score=88.97 TRINITY_DN7615_c0_g1_i24:85-1077(+)